MPKLKAELPLRQGEPPRPEKSAAGGKNSGTVLKNALSPKNIFAKQENRPPESNLSPLNTFSKDPLSGKTAETSGERIVFAREVFKQIAVSLGLPQDSLSVTLIAFLRFFSLSPDPVFLKNLRREILSAVKSSSPGAAKEKAALEAEALAKVIVLDKGVDLSPEALERLVQYLAPMDLSEEPRTIEEQPKKDNFLDFLNSLPGKSGRYWKIFPFKINVRGTELKVFLRLLKRDPLYPEESEYIIADIAGPKGQWRFFLGKTEGKLRADIRVYPGLSDGALKLLQREAELFLGKAASAKAGSTTESGNGNFNGFDEIYVRNGEEMPSWMDVLCDESLPSVNEEI